MQYSSNNLSSLVSRRTGGLEKSKRYTMRNCAVSRRTGGLEIVALLYLITRLVSRRTGGLENCFHPSL